MAQDSRRVFRLLFAVLMLHLVVWSPATRAANSYEDLRGRFAIDLPRGWVLEQEEAGVFIFKGGDGLTLGIAFLADQSDLGALLTMPLDAIRSSVPNAAPHEDALELTVNGHPARWCVFRGSLTSSGVEIGLYGLVGAVVLKDGGVSLFATLNEQAYKAWGEAIRQSFHSIRDAGAPITGAGAARPIKLDLQPVANASAPAATTAPAAIPSSGASAGAAAAAATPGSATQFEHEIASLTLPPGWSSQPTTGAAFASFERSSGGSLTLIKAPFLQQTQKGVYKIARKGLLDGAPSMKATGGGPYPVETNLKDAMVERYSGPIVFEGREIRMNAIIAVAKGKRGYFYGIGIAAAGAAVDEIEAIIRSLH